MEFKKWLQNEVAKARPKNIDIGNLAIGRIGPMGTFGQDTRQSIPAWAAASAFGAMGKSLRQELGSLGLDPAHNLLPLSSLKDTHKEGMELPLQIPTIYGQKNPMFNVARSSDKLVLSAIVANIKVNPLESPLVRKPKETKPEMQGKFELVSYKDEDQGKVELAKKFTEGLIKIILLYKLTYDLYTVTKVPLARIYDVQNPQVASKYYTPDNQLGLVLSYKRLQNVPDDVDNDYTAQEPEPEAQTQEKGNK